MNASRQVVFDSVAARSPTTRFDISIVIPACDEEGNVFELAKEIAAVLRGRLAFEILSVDDGSTDGTAQAVRSARDAVPEVRLLRHPRRAGPSAALASGIRAARAEWLATLDADGQNDPADIVRLVQARDTSAADPRLVAGIRMRRHDSWLRRISSRVANSVRARLLGDDTPDPGCGIKLLHRKTFVELPYFDHMHRFLPALYQRQGMRTISVPVNHRPRRNGRSKYDLRNRLWVGIVDLLGVMWLKSRFRPPLQTVEETRNE
jgi:dolichol-phosphate mannosyltransferase